jgi:hypothetical protein
MAVRMGNAGGFEPETPLQHRPPAKVRLVPGGVSITAPKPKAR